MFDAIKMTMEQISQDSTTTRPCLYKIMLEVVGTEDVCLRTWDNIVLALKQDQSRKAAV